MKKIMQILLCILLCSCCALAWAGKKEAVEEEAVADLPQDNIVEEITAGEMNDRFSKNDDKGYLYLRFSEDRVVVFDKLAEDKASCTQIVMAVPKQQMLQVYSRNEKAFNTMYKAISKYSHDNKAINGYKCAVDKSKPVMEENGTKFYKLWFEKVKANKVVKTRRRGLGLPFGIGIGIGHHGHRGIGIGL